MFLISYPEIKDAIINENKLFETSCSDFNEPPA